LLDGPEIGAHIALPFSQIHDWIADNLAWTMISDIAAAIGWIKFDPGAAQRSFAREQVLGVAVASLRNDVRVLDEQELIGNQALLAPFDEIALDRKRISVPHAAQVFYIKTRNFKH
jgi:hypothetical protein